jgi:hypothetical protein
MQARPTSRGRRGGVLSMLAAWNDVVFAGSEGLAGR